MEPDYNLSELATIHGTDKGPDGHNYTRHYQKLFRRHRVDPVHLLEIGVFRGASLRMWDAWFTHPKARIVGVDIHPEQSVFTDRVKTVVADINSYQPPGEVDIVVDDGSHIPADVITAHRRLWPHVAPGGWYVVEDVHLQVTVTDLTQNLWLHKPDVAEVHVFPSQHPAHLELSQPWQIVFLKKVS